MTTPAAHSMELALRQLIAAIPGETPSRPGLKDTPRRAAAGLLEFLSGYSRDPAELFEKNFASSLENVEGHLPPLVSEGPIGFYSMCEHHLMPFHGQVYVFYQPYKKVCGASKLARLVEIYAARLQVQERMAEQILSILRQELDPVRAGVMIRGSHMCMSARGVKAHAAEFVTVTDFGHNVSNPNLALETFNALFKL